MYIIAGLGNPGRKYVETRHNVGFEIIDVLCAKYDIKLNKSKFQAVFGEGTIGGEKVVLSKPQTYMNLSGESVREMMEWYKLENDRLIVICDDVSMTCGKLRIREKGSAGGHNGLKNIIYQLGTEEFTRIKIGVGSPENPEYDIKDWVLGKFNKEETEALVKTAVRTVDAVKEIILCDAKSAMNKYNG